MTRKDRAIVLIGLDDAAVARVIAQLNDEGYRITTVSTPLDETAPAPAHMALGAFLRAEADGCESRLPVDGVAAMAAPLPLRLPLEDPPLLARPNGNGTCAEPDVDLPSREAHAAGRWARALVPLLEAPRDPRTITDWGDCVAASPGTLKTWCRAARMGPRRSLIFGRLLRAAYHNEAESQTLSNLLDVVDPRTIGGFMRLAGFKDEDDFPKTVRDFIERQRLIQDRVAIFAIKRALGRRGNGVHDSSAVATLLALLEVCLCHLQM